MPGRSVTLIGAAGHWIGANSFAPTWLYGRWRHPLAGYLAATVAQCAAILVAWLLTSFWPTFSFPALLPFLVMTLVSLNWGVGPGICTMVVGLVLMERVIEAPWSPTEPGDLVEVILFIAVGAVTILVASQTERAHQEAHALAAREAQTAALLDAVIEAMAEGVEVIDPQGRVLRANTRLRDLLALREQADYATRSIQERLRAWNARDERGRAVPPDGAPAARVLCGETFTGADALEMRVRAFDGRELEVSVSGAPIYDRREQRVGGVLVISDVTERRRLERRTRDALEALLGMAEALVLRADVAASGEEGETPPAARRLAELTRRVLGCRRVSIGAIDQATGLLRPVAAAGFAPAETQAWRTRAVFSLQTPHFGLDATQAARLRSGEVLVLGMEAPSGACWLDPDDMVGSVVAPMRIDTQLVGLLVVDDGERAHEPLPDELALLGAVAQLAAIVVERERLLKTQAEAVRLAELDRLRTDFIATVSHDLQTPLTSIRAGLDLLNAALGAVLAPNEHDLLLAVRRNAERLRVRVSALLTANQLDAGALRLDPAKIDLRHVVMAAVTTVQPLFVEKGQTLAVDLPEPLPVVGDAHRLEEVMVNLLANAHRHTPAGTHVVLAGWPEAGEAHLCVRDDGPGIPPQELDAVFARFHRRGRAAGGSGLGLSISRSIITLHAGRLWAESPSGLGATFHLTLPRDGGRHDT